MRNSILLIVLALFFSMNMTGCSLFSSGDEEQENATISEENPDGVGEVTDGDFRGEGDFAADDFESGSGDFDPTAMAKDEGGKLGDLAGGDVEVEDSFGDLYADDAYGSATSAAVDDFSEDYIDDNSFSSSDSDSSLFVDEGGGLPSDTMSSNQEADLFGQDAVPVVDTPVIDSGYGALDSGYDSVYEASGGSYVESKSFVSVKKMKPAAYRRAGGNINRLYIVRSGDNMDSIAEKIYGDSTKAEALYSYNSHFRGKTLNVGDKIYYESPNNPNDQAMQTYYEDNNMAPQYYTSVEGDNIRKVSKQLLGHNRSWMEVYATNENVESKGNLPGGLQLRYWPEGSVGQPVAMNDPVSQEPEPITDADPMPEPEAVSPAEPNDMAMGDPVLDEPEMDEPKDVAINDLDDPNDEIAPPPPVAGSMDPPPPKPVAPPPPPAPNRFNKPKPPSIGGTPSMTDDPMAAIGNDSTIMAALGGLLILAFIIMLIFIRRSRAKRVNFSQTQV